ncbi:MAG: NADH-quinone oxidoreductase subunit N [Acidobacteria bacterium]|nr:NADH-quinone oxidoreductase subunit N [Acidobacteriota bacterium]
MSEFLRLVPETILSAVASLVMLLSPAQRRRDSRVPGILSGLGLAAAAGATVLTWNQRTAAFGGMVLIDGFSQLARLLIYGIFFCVSVAAIDFLRREEINFGEFYALLLFVAAGASLMVVSADLILTFLGIEVLSIGAYILAGFKRENQRCTEASLKYFLLGAFSTALLLYGVALLYGRTGSTRYAVLASRLQTAPDFITLAALSLLVAGFGFKAAVVPFHVWTPDVYEGAPTPVTTLLSIGSKGAALLAFVRIFYWALGGLAQEWSNVLWIASVVTMFLGNITALTQNNIKRLLAYSSIAHAGYILLGFVAHNRSGIEAILFYTLAYALMNAGAFTVVQLVSRRGDNRVLLSDYTGLGQRHRWLAASLSLFLFSLAGIPATAGFMGKLFLFSAAVERGLFWLVILAVISSAIAAYYYIRIVVLMFMREADPAGEPIPTPSGAAAVIILAIVGTLLLGIFPGLFMGAAETAATGVVLR